MKEKNINSGTLEATSVRIISCRPKCARSTCLYAGTGDEKLSHRLYFFASILGVRNGTFCAHAQSVIQSVFNDDVTGDVQ
jgi:hypothetical protein